MGAAIQHPRVLFHTACTRLLHYPVPHRLKCQTLCSVQEVEADALERAPTPDTPSASEPRMPTSSNSPQPNGQHPPTDRKQSVNHCVTVFPLHSTDQSCWQELCFCVCFTLWGFPVGISELPDHNLRAVQEFDSRQFPIKLHQIAPKILWRSWNILCYEPMTLSSDLDCHFASVYVQRHVLLQRQRRAVRSRRLMSRHGGTVTSCGPGAWVPSAGLSPRRRRCVVGHAASHLGSRNHCGYALLLRPSEEAARSNPRV